MDTGEPGHHGHLVLSHVEQGSKQRHENATDRKLNLEVRHAQDIVLLTHTAIYIHVQLMENGRRGVVTNHVASHAEEEFRREPGNVVTQNHYTEEKHVPVQYLLLDLVIHTIVRLMVVGQHGICGENAASLAEEVVRIGYDSALNQNHSMEEILVVVHEFNPNNVVQNHVQSMVDGVLTELMAVAACHVVVVRK